MYNSVTVHVVDKTLFIDKIFAYIPSNAFINKGRCGIGGTTLEIKNKNRCSIIVAPTVGILLDKKASHSELVIVWENVSVEDVAEQLNLKLPAQKIMTTPEGLRKVILAAESLGLLDEIKRDWFLLLDECHTFISEDYRKGILKPFDYFWEFQNKAIISATPYFFSDERFRTLDYYEIKFTESLGKITLINCRSVPATLEYIIKESFAQDGRLHIFLNSVTEIARVVRRLGLTDVNIFCANDKDKKNMAKLGDLQQFYTEQPDKDNFKKVNFYTSRYFEGWDMHDPGATIVLVTDVHNAHTKVSVGMKLKQAAGRYRKPLSEAGKKMPEPVILHITNHYNNLIQPRSIESLKIEYEADAKHLLNQHTEYTIHCEALGKKLEHDPRLEKYADFQYKTQLAILNPMKIDQQVNQAYSHEIYNNIALIEKEWLKNYYDVEVKHYDGLLETKTSMKRKSKAEQLKEDYWTIINERKQSQEIVYHFGETMEDKMRISNPLAYQAARFLDPSKMDALRYNLKEVESEIIIVSNAKQEVKLLQLLAQQFKPGNTYSSSQISSILQQIYTSLNLRDAKSGKLIIAKATHLANKGWFDISKCKLPDEEGKYTIHGYLIQRAQFNLRVAA